MFRKKKKKMITRPRCHHLKGHNHHCYQQCGQYAGSHPG